MHVLYQNTHLQLRENRKPQQCLCRAPACLINHHIAKIQSFTNSRSSRFPTGKGFEFCRFDCVSVQQQASTLEPLFIVEIAVHSINRSAKHKNVFKGLYLPVNGRLAKVITILKHISGLLCYSTSPVHPYL